MIRNMAFTAAILGVCAGSLLALESPSGSNLGNVRGGDFTAARSIIEKKCTRCHSDKRIDAALSAGKKMQGIQQEMERKGATLSDKEREVLGIYWKKNPLKLK